MLVGNSSITEVNELQIFTLQYLNLRFRFFECKFFTFITVNSGDRNRLNLKEMSKQKHGKDFFNFGFKKENTQRFKGAL